MLEYLNALIANEFFAFLLIFMRLGTALMIMPGIGDNFVPMQVRLLLALVFSFILTPILSPYLPVIPTQTFSLAILLISEAFIGMFIGTVMRLMMSALDTAGSVASVQSGFANAMLFNPITAGQGSLVGALYATLGLTLLFVTDLHHFMLASIVDSYQIFTVDGSALPIGDMTAAISRLVTLAFKTGVQIALPFLIIGMIMQIGFGVLGRLMPQIQIYFLALPLQIIMGLTILSMSVSVGIMFWLQSFDSTIGQYLTP